MKERNHIIKSYCRENGVPLWVLGEAMGYGSDSAFSRRLRKELSDAEIESAKKIVDRLAKKAGR